MRSPLLLLTLAPLALAAACDPFSPDLGETPFRCGDAEPRCPTDYECVEYTPTEQLCEGVGDGPAPFDCDDDSPVEPNDSIAQPYQTPVASQRDSIPYGSLAICPAGDIDTYQVDIVANGTNLTATAQFVDADAPLMLELLSQNGTLILAGSDTGQNRVEAAATNLPVGVYFVQVSGVPGDRNNYSLNLSTTP